MKRAISLLVTGILVATTVGFAAQSQSQSVIKKFKGETIAAKDIDENGGADAYGNSGDNQSSRYFVNPDFYRMKSDENLTIIEGFKTMQQTAEWSCGNVTALMTLTHFGERGVTEYDIAKVMGSHTDKDVKGSLPGSANNTGEYGTNVEQMYKYFAGLKNYKVVETSYQNKYTEKDLVGSDQDVPEQQKGNLPGKFSSMSLYASENDDNTDKFVEDAKDSYFVKWLTGNLNAGRPVMVEWSDWGGHWQAIIGYDNNGTPGIGDDMLIFADPYDTSDHWQDGYFYYPLERWFYQWSDHSVAPKPYQIQPFIVVDKK